MSELQCIVEEYLERMHYQVRPKRRTRRAGSIKDIMLDENMRMRKAAGTRSRATTPAPGPFINAGLTRRRLP